MIITGIKPVGKGRYEIFLDEGSYPAFALYRKELKKFDIREGEDLSDDVRTEIYSDVLVKRAILRLYHLIESRDYTERELRDRLRRGSYPLSVIDKAVAQLKAQGLADDMDYAVRYADCYIDRKSKKAVVQALVCKGVESGVAAEAVEQACESRIGTFFPGDSYGECYDESNKIRRLLEKRHFDPKTADNKEYNKQIAYLMGKGFNFRDINKTIKIMCECTCELNC